jgi:hypothetical protein
MEQFNFFSYINYYGKLMFGICGINAMPAKEVKIIFTGSMADCKRYYNAYQSAENKEIYLTGKEYFFSNFQPNEDSIEGIKD